MKTWKIASLLLAVWINKDVFAWAPIYSFAGNNPQMATMVLRSAKDPDVTSTEPKISSPLSGPITPRCARILLPTSALLTIATAPEPTLALAQDGGFEAARNACFPGSLSSSVVALRIAGALRKRGYFPYNTVLGSCICSDELNTTPNSLIAVLQNKMSSTDAGVYSMGGSCGVPPTPESSFVEFISHVPTSGKLLLLIAPNVGITKDGTVGKVERLGQDAASDTCAPIAKKGLGTNEAVAAATAELYDVMWSKISAEISSIATKRAELWSKVGELSVVGGIIVNRGHGSGMSKGEDYFQPLMMRSYSGSGQTQLYDDVFGDLRTPREKV